MKFNHRYSPSRGTSFDQEGQKSKTRMSEADSCDINKIMERFNRTGQLPNVQRIPPQYGEAIAMDFQTAQQLIHDAREAFMKLPAKTRSHFHNDPGIYMDAISNATPEDTEALLKLGIMVEREPTPADHLRDISANIKNLKTEKVETKA